MRLYDDLAVRSSTGPPTKRGFYAWWQIAGALPGVPGTAHPSAELELLYVGIAPKDALSMSNLRKRLAKHHRAAIGSPTFRLDLTAFLWGHAAGSPAGLIARWPDHKVWWRNLMGEGGPVRLIVRGRRLEGHAVATREPGDDALVRVQIADT
jgi:hypothetical protein